jgi:hypothetical protein
MTEYQQTIINNFHLLVKDHDMECIHKNFEHIQCEYDVYSVRYKPIISSFISELTGLDKSSINQYISAQQFLFLLSDGPVIDIRVCLTVCKNFVSIDLKQFIDVDKFEFDNPEFLKVKIMPNDKVTFTDYDRHSLLESSLFESSYDNLLQHIKSIVDPDIDSFKQVLELSNKNTFNVLTKKLEQYKIKAISPSEFGAVYLNDPNFEYIDESYIGLSENTFMNFLKDNFPIHFCSQLSSILSVSFFQEKLRQRTINWHSLADCYILFPTVSKYAKFNSIYRIAFSAMPYDDYRCEISVLDDGTISFCYYKDGVGIELTDLYDIYDYIKEGLISHIEKTLDVNRKDLTIPHLKLYSMILV